MNKNELYNLLLAKGREAVSVIADEAIAALRKGIKTAAESLSISMSEKPKQDEQTRLK